MKVRLTLESDTGVALDDKSVDIGDTFPYQMVRLGTAEEAISVQLFLLWDRVKEK